MDRETANDRCDCDVIHEEAVGRVRARLPDEEALCDLADLYKVFGDSTRIRILSAVDGDELCVCDIAALLGMSKSAISHQLRLLRQAGLVRGRRDGKIVFYSLADEHVHGILDLGLVHLSELR